MAARRGQCHTHRKRMIMRQNKSLMLGLGAAIALIGLSGCASWQRDGDRTAGRVIDDRRITGNVEESLGREPVFKFSDVDVRTFNGVVQLSGFVNTEEQKQRAGELARQVDGVAQVVNSITLKQPQLAPTGRTNGVDVMDADTTYERRGTNTNTNTIPE